MNADFVAAPRHFLHLLWEGFQRVTGNKPGGFQIVFFKQFEQPRCADFAGKHAARDIVRTILAAIGTQPAGDRIYIHAISHQNLFCHDFLLLSAVGAGRAPNRAG